MEQFAVYVFPKPLAQVSGWPVNIANMDQAVAEICAAGKLQQSFATFTLNLDHLVLLRRSEVFRKAYRTANLVTADGAPVAYLASRSGRTVTRTTGADLVEPLARRAAAEGLSVYLFGTTEATLASVSRQLTSQSQQTLRIAGAVSPPFGFDPTGPEADRALDRIAKSGAQICFVALGSYKGELFAARGIERGIRTGFVCVGAALDFISGQQLRAPKAVQRARLEWAWRLAHNPKRLATRYARCALLLPLIAFHGSQVSQTDHRSQ